MSFESIPQRIFRAGRERGHVDAYAVREGDRWVTTGWADYADEVMAAARALVGLGIEKGTPVAILSTNTPEWVIFDVGAMTIGAMPAGIYPTNVPDECAYVINHSGTPIVLVQNETQLDKILEKRGEMPGLRHIVMMRGESSDADGVMTWEEFLAHGNSVDPKRVEALLDDVGPDDPGTLIYTSGTTGPPKAVVLSHEALLFVANGIHQLAGIGPSDTTISYLPLSHIAEQIVTVLTPPIMGHTVHYEPDMTRLVDTLKEVRPTVFFAVPRVWEKFYLGVSGKLGAETGVKAWLVNRALTVGRAHSAVLDRGEQPGKWLETQFNFFDKIVYSKAKEAVGMDRCEFMFSSAAPLSPDVARYLEGLGLRILQVYGLSECGVAAANGPHSNRIGTVGPALPGAEIVIADDGEILTRGPHVFSGYLHNPEATAAALDADGWLHTGDIGEIDNDGYLTVTDRKKDIIVTAGGENITPSLLEMAILMSPIISNAIIIGEGRPYITALITVDPEATAGMTDEAIHDAVEAAIDEANTKQARIRRVKKFVILDTPLTIERGELTPTLKVKRKIVREHFADEIEQMYD